MSQVNITKDVQALHAYEKAKQVLESSTTYFFTPDGTPTHEDDWEEQQGESGDYWSYMFMSDEEALLHYYLGEASKEEVDNLCHVLMLGTGDNQDFHHALFNVLKEFC